MPSEERVGILITARDMASSALHNVTGALSRLEAGAGQVGKGLGQVGGGLLRIGTLAATVAAAGIGLAVNSAIKFQSAMELIQTQAGASADEVQKMSKALLGLAPAVGSTPEDLAAGLFHVESAGFRGAAALDVLTVAAQGAKVGHADLESVTNALVGALNSGVGGIQNTTEAMGVLNAIVGSGNLRMQDLADAFGTGILSSAKNFGVSIQSVGAAIADMTRQGIPAQDAATRLRMSLSLLAAPTPKAAKLLESIGISSTQLATDMRGPGGILAAMEDLRQHLDASGLSATEQAALLSHAFGGGRSSSAILTLVGDVKQLGAVQDQVNVSTKTFPDAWVAAQATVKVQLDKLKAGLSASGISVGTAILPALTPWMDKLSAFLSTHQPEIAAMGQQLSAGVSSFGDALSKVDWGPPLSGLKIARDLATTVIDAFLKLPPAWQGAIISGLALNKLSGGLLGQGVGNIAGGLFQIVFQRGSSPAHPLWVQSVGGIGGPGGPGAPGGPGLWAAAIPIAVGIAAVAETTKARGQYSGINDNLAAAGLTSNEIAAAKTAVEPDDVRRAAARGGHTVTAEDIGSANAKLATAGITVHWDAETRSLYLEGNVLNRQQFAESQRWAGIASAEQSKVNANAARTLELQASSLSSLQQLASRSPVVNVYPDFTANVTVNYDARLAAAAIMQIRLQQGGGTAGSL